MSGSNNKQLTLPALRGVMGNWVYYTCLMSVQELSERVRFAEEVHKNKNLSGMIQRQLRLTRSAQIANYIKNQPERFFNSLVVATYGGQPNWHAISSVKSKPGGPELGELSEEALESVGFLSFRGDEELFALDGQHRLAGIKKAVAEGLPEDHADELSVIFVAHKTTPQGLERTRRLFTTLNKTARPVSKGDIIALDEDDAMAICVRKLIEETDFFSGDKIAFVASNNMPTKNAVSITTIGNLYDVLITLFTQIPTEIKARKADLQRIRPSDDKLDAYFELSKKFFGLLDKNFSEVQSYFKSGNPETVVQQHRGPHGGTALFRPIGLDIFAKVIAKLSKHMTLEKAVALASKLPRNLGEAPYSGLMWSPSTKTISNAHTITVREVLMHMVGVSKYSEATLLSRYRKAMADETAQLPPKVT
ncbi:hypothetical protein C7T35_34515 [Variovorax sp. WS11]|uniref:DGQHR domain-containing protein n=1 Tax=Variovorax sp. WS11 TaxID=1105204 RepID=UPI000D0D229C|nr:DGQHR domain-containing protein [Variovorax sp. WS11]NDZ17783.1 DGQHR domain-containing protein [Variovorax sp. WS11]PSL80037.1 hypothetical protein C7T35_34515 [Variovorax sp. WS11]